MDTLLRTDPTPTDPTLDDQSPIDTGPARRSTTAAAVLRATLDHGPVARSTVAQLTGLSAGAVSRQLADLRASGLVRERPALGARRSIGRPHVPVDIDTRRHVVAGIHIAVGHATFALMDLRGRVLAEHRAPFPTSDAAAALDGIADDMSAFLATQARRPLALGVATGGWVDPGSGVVVRHTPLSWSDVPVGQVLARRLGLRVLVEGHARALARAEQLIGAQRQRARRSMVQLFVGNVVDAAFATCGDVHAGPGASAGDVSHLPVGGDAACACGRTGCFEAEVSSRVLAERAVADGRLAAPHVPDALAALERGEPWALRLFRSRSRAVGRAVALLLDVINPEVLVVTDSATARRPELLADLHEEVARRSHVCADPAGTVVAGSFGTGALAVAAGSVVLSDLFARPLDLPART
ncbi:ROK family transcriptional regulator [Pseudonocardia sp. TRM90224]|uniref:ROK family transcriptional regulator n=1 Tax=Pseudonocardia sp. TRM90224 TaxID=2812678 RepID=UPI001E4576F0|nr:ROK family transcriptional regulator [Pseudonocardia sp. TRM90224]